MRVLRLWYPLNLVLVVNPEHSSTPPTTLACRFNTAKLPDPVPTREMTSVERLQ